jgi:hypothetical protein
MEKERQQDTGKATDLLCLSSARTMVSAVILCVFITALAQEPDLKHWYEERRVENHKFRCALTKNNRLTISALIVETKDYPIATFYCDIKNKAEIEEAISIVDLFY